MWFCEKTATYISDVCGLHAIGIVTHLLDDHIKCLRFTVSQGITNYTQTQRDVLESQI